MTVSVAVPARVHLAGNPSDGYRGAVVSTTVPDLEARVTITTADHFSVAEPGVRWTSLDDLVDSTGRYGHEGSTRLVTAALVALDRALPGPVDARPGHFRCETTIPRSVGLGGSSAIVLATMQAAMRWWGVEDVLTPLELATAALAAETDDLGIGAGLADRTVQAVGGTVLTDCRPDTAAVRRVDVAAPIRLSVVWNPRAAAPSGEYHRELRRRVAGGDPDTADALRRLGLAADQAAEALRTGDGGALGVALDDSLDLRCRLGSVPPEALAGVDRLRADGAAVNFAGSGGSLVVLGDIPVPAGAERRSLTIPATTESSPSVPKPDR